MKKLFVPVSGTVTYLFTAITAFASSVDPCAGATDIAKVTCDLATHPARTIRNIVVFFVILAVIIALMYLLYGGIKWITSKGEKTEVESARNHIMAALIGLIVVVLAVFLLSIVLSAFGISLDQLAIPNLTSGS